MSLESATYIHQLNATNPVGGTDNVDQGDDHIRLLKSTIQASFPNIAGAMTVSHTRLNELGAMLFTGTGLANPATSIGLTAVNGTATTAMRSDAAPALNQAIAPTWTGSHAFNGVLLRTSSSSGISHGVLASGALAGIGLHVSGAPTNAKHWELITDNAGGLTLQTLDDAVTTTRALLTAGRSGVGITTLIFGNATDNPSYNFAGSGFVTFSGGALGLGAASRRIGFGPSTYGTIQVAGDIGGSGYAGVQIYDVGGVTPTFMSNGTNAGIHSLVDTKWLILRSSSTEASTGYNFSAPSFNVP